MLTATERNAVETAASIIGDRALNPELMEAFRRECEGYAIERHIIDTAIARAKQLVTH